MGAEFDDDGDRAGLGQLRQVLVAVPFVGERLPGGEHHLPAFEQVRQVGEVADVDPSHGSVEQLGTVGTAHQLGVAGDEHRQRQDLPDRRLH